MYVYVYVYVCLCIWRVLDIRSKKRSRSDTSRPRIHDDNRYTPDIHPISTGSDGNRADTNPSTRTTWKHRTWCCCRGERMCSTSSGTSRQVVYLGFFSTGEGRVIDEVYPDYCCVCLYFCSVFWPFGSVLARIQSFQSIQLLLPRRVARTRSF